MAGLRSGLVTLAFLLGLGLAAAQQSQPQQGQPQQGQPQQGPRPQGESLAQPEQKAQQEKAQHSEPGRAGTTEPSAEETRTAKPEETAPFVNGRLAAPGAPEDSQTVPAKFSKRNAELDGLPTMAFPLPLTDEQRQRIREAVSKVVAEGTGARVAELLPSGANVRELPPDVTEQIPATRNLGYVRTSDKILLVTPASRIVVGEIPDQGSTGNQGSTK